MHVRAHTHTTKYYSAIKNWNLAFCDNMDGPGGYYAKWNKSDRERQIPCDLTYMCDLKTKTDNENRLIGTENKQVVVRREAGRGCWEK